MSMDQALERTFLYRNLALGRTFLCAGAQTGELKTKELSP